MYGHQAGDDCLKRLSDILINGHFTRRPGDLIARYFGEEFVVILYGTPEKYAVKISESICHTVKDMQIPHAGTKVAGSSVVTVSLGVATETPDMGSTPQELFVKADKTLYEAKKNGRNTVEIFKG
jgi:diguanylate cyclase (GGDEF)-like protein